VAGRPSSPAGCCGRTGRGTRSRSGIILGDAAAQPTQTLGPVWLAGHSAMPPRERTGRYTFGELDPPTVSEIFADPAEPAASAD